MKFMNRIRTFWYYQGKTWECAVLVHTMKAYRGADLYTSANSFLTTALEAGV